MVSFPFCHKNTLSEKGEMLYGKFITYYGQDYNFQTLVLRHPKGKVLVNHAYSGAGWL